MKLASEHPEQGDSRQKLIAAATELFSSKGFHAVSVREICEKAQVNISLISYYFTGKEGLLGAIIEELTKGRAEQFGNLIQRFDSKEEFESRLREFLDGIVVFYLENSFLMRLFLEELEKSQPEAERVFSLTFFKTFDAFKKFLLKGLDAGYLRANTRNGIVLSVQLLGPFLNLMRSEICTTKFYKVSLSDPKFRKDLVNQVVSSILA